MGNYVINEIYSDGYERFARDVYKRFERPMPTEIKMIYEKKTGKFSVKYKYDEVCSAKTGIGAGEVFDNWITEVERAGNNKDI